MAKMNTKFGTAVDSVEYQNRKYTYRSDGAVLYQWRYNGRLQPATVRYRGVSREKWDTFKAKALAN